MSKHNAQALLIGAGVVILVTIVAVSRQDATSGSAKSPHEPGVTATRGLTATGERLPRMLDLGADKCIPCKQMAPILAELKVEYAGRATIEFIDVWKNPEASKQYGVRVIPTQIFYDINDREVWRHEGFLGKDDIVARLKELGAR